MDRRIMMPNVAGVFAMLLNFRDSRVKARIRPLFDEDCARIARGELPERAWETDIYVTRRCNMSCSYCYIKEYFDRGQVFKDPDIQLLRCLIDRIAPKTYGLVVLGGEPLIRKDLSQVLAYAREQGIPSIRISSNGTFVNDSTEALRYVDRLNISLDATRKREFPQLVAKMLVDVPQAKQAMGNEFPAVCISYTLSHSEVFDTDILPIINYARTNGFDIKFLPCKYPNKDVNWELLRTVVDRAREYVDDGALLNISDLVTQISHEFLFRNCLQGMQFYIDFEGHFLYPCDEYPEHRVGRIYDHSVENLYRMGVEKYGRYPSATEKTCLRCKSYCHAENSYGYRHPERQLANLG
jgi:organic radical activating enzyme